MFSRHFFYIIILFSSYLIKMTFKRIMIYDLSDKWLSKINNGVKKCVIHFSKNKLKHKNNFLYKLWFFKSIICRPFWYIYNTFFKVSTKSWWLGGGGVQSSPKNIHFLRFSEEHSSNIIPIVYLTRWFFFSPLLIMAKFGDFLLACIRMSVHLHIHLPEKYKKSHIFKILHQVLNIGQNI